MVIAIFRINNAQRILIQQATFVINNSNDQGMHDNCEQDDSE